VWLETNDFAEIGKIVIVKMWRMDEGEAADNEWSE
jgi:hypothetical protein